MIHSKYQSEIEKQNRNIHMLRRKSNVLLAAKLIFFGSSAFWGYLTFTQFSYLTLLGTLFLFAAYITVCVIDNRYRKEIDSYRRIKKICQNEQAYLNGDFSAFFTGDKFINPEHEYSFDLDLFGPTSLFHRINRCVTEKGCHCLADELTHLCQEKDEIIRRQSAINELANLSEWRIKYMGNEYIPNHAEMLSNFIAKRKEYGFLVRSNMAYVFIGITVTAFLLALIRIIPWTLFFIPFLFNLGCSILFFKKVMASNANHDKLHKELATYVEVLKDIENGPFKSPLLTDLHNQLFNENASALKAFSELTHLLNLFNQRSNEVVYVLFNGFALFDILLLKKMKTWENRYLTNINRWLECIARMDALVSFANYAYNHPQNVTAEILPEEHPSIVEATDIYHPFLAYKHAVPNNFTLRKGNVAIVTGANMAGKSTFLRTMGLNYILACNGVPVCASCFKFSIVSLFSGMRTTDNLSKDISYFNAELLRLKQLIQHIKFHSNTFIILDEILKGTNSRDKLEGSKLFLQEITRYNIAALIATHDLELAKLEEENQKVFCNYCFEIELSKHISYSYHISKGVARNLNASFLLRNILEEMEEKKES